MPPSEPSAGRIGLERSCTDWIAGVRPGDGVELFQARFVGRAYARHRHDTYAIGVTDDGVQVFDYRGATRASRAGQAVVLHPDENHDGRAGTAAGFAYRIVYVEPALVADALRALRGRPAPLPFVREPVSTSTRLARAVRHAFRDEPSALAVDDLIVELAEGLLAEAEGGAGSVRPVRLDVARIERARRFLDAEHARGVDSAELEAITGLSRYELARQFRFRLGTSPHRYQLMRRLEAARRQMRDGDPLAAVAHDTGFADQAHFTRTFRSAFGLTPGRYRALDRPRGLSPASGQSARPPRPSSPGRPR